MCVRACVPLVPFGSPRKAAVETTDLLPTSNRLPAAGDWGQQSSEDDAADGGADLGNRCRRKLGAI